MSLPCPFCDSVERLPMGGRADAVCAVCGSLERHRSLVRVAKSELSNGAGRSCLEAGPLNHRVFGDYLRERGWRYVSVDRWRTGNPHDPRAVGFVDYEADLTDLSIFGGGDFDLFIAQHVIEEIPDYGRALAEIRRVLRSPATALLEIPFRVARPRSAPQPADRFGNVWAFGADLPAEVRSHFPEVDVRTLGEGSYNGEVLVCRK